MNVDEQERSKRCQVPIEHKKWAPTSIDKAQQGGVDEHQQNIAREHR